ncbi:MAG TPA: hypothetical protein VN283_02045 [Thiobacillus sp.]|nr:hypothetical protein [Thiobacillus sp.]
MLNAHFIEFLRVRLEAEAAAETAVNARLLFWDGVLQALPSQHAQAA